MMCKRWLAALAAVLLLGLARPARADEVRLLILLGERTDAAAQGTQLVLRRLMMYQNMACDYADAWGEVSLEGYTAVLISAGDTDCLNEATVRRIGEAGLPVFVLGGGGLKQLTRAAWTEGTVVVRCRSAEGTDEDRLTPASGLTLPHGEYEDLGMGSVYLSSREYPLCGTRGLITYMAYFDPTSSAMCAALATALHSWLWPYSSLPTEYGQYLVLNQVYPFYEPARLMQITDMLEEEGVPYAVSVMPLYSNAEYPAMKRFCEWLRYVQSTGAGIVLRSPLVSLEYVDQHALKEHTRIAYQAYAQYGVYPIAIQAPQAYLFSERGLSYLAGFRTVLMFESDDALSDTITESNAARRDGHRLIAPAWQHQAYTGAYAQAIYLDVNQPVEELREQVRRIKASRRVLKSLTAMENTVYIGEDFIRMSADGTLRVNSVPVNLAYVPMVHEDFVYDRGFEEFLKEEIEASNRYIILFVLGACGFFLTGIALSRRAIRRQLFRAGWQRPSAPEAPKEEEAP